MTKHTPTPWRIDNRSKGRNAHSIIDFNNESLAVCQVMNDDNGTLTTAKANAAHIVKCVNNYDRLVAIIKKLRQQLYDVAPFSIKTEALLKEAEALLKELEEV